MKRGHSKSGLFLFELIFAILFFALASAVCVRLFAQAHLTSLHSRDLSQALLEAQSAAECFKSSPNDPARLAVLLDGKQDGNSVLLEYGRDWERTDREGEYRLMVQLEEADDGEPYSARITVSKSSEAKSLYTLEVKKYLPKG